MLLLWIVLRNFLRHIFSVKLLIFNLNIFVYFFDASIFCFTSMFILICTCCSTFSLRKAQPLEGCLWVGDRVFKEMSLTLS